MNKLVKFPIFIALFSSMTLFAQNSLTTQTPDGADIFESKGCSVCHDTQMERIAPSLQYIATMYQGDENALVTFLKGEKSAIVQPESASVMQPQLMKIKSLYEDEIRALARYIVENR